MQRQIRTLKMHGRRSAFALIIAVFLMLVISLMLLKMISYSTENAQQVVSDYLLEQAKLAAYGATEFAILAASTDNRATACTSQITMDFPSTGNKLFDVVVNIQYVWLNTAIPTGSDCSNTSVRGSAVVVTTPEEQGSAYVDVTVTSDAALGLDTPIRFHRRTLQKL